MNKEKTPVRERLSRVEYENKPAFEAIEIARRHAIHYGRIVFVTDHFTDGKITVYGLTIPADEAMDRLQASKAAFHEVSNNWFRWWTPHQVPTGLYLNGWYAVGPKLYYPEV